MMGLGKGNSLYKWQFFGINSLDFWGLYFFTPLALHPRPSGILFANARRRKGVEASCLEGVLSGSSARTSQEDSKWFVNGL